MMITFLLSPSIDSSIFSIHFPDIFYITTTDITISYCVHDEDGDEEEE